jgi:hypothetical protein
MYQASVPVSILGLENLSNILGKANAQALDKKIDPLVLTTSRLYPDMFPLTKQIFIATDVVKGGIARLAGLEIPAYPDEETTFTELQNRIAKTISFIKTVTPQQIDGSENKHISLKVGGKEMTFIGQDYLFKFVLPNLYFHSTTTYAILRHNGIDIGKSDYLGNIQ